jgi:hypothetical protein
MYVVLQLSKKNKIKHNTKMHLYICWTHEYIIIFQICEKIIVFKVWNHVFNKSEWTKQNQHITHNIFLVEKSNMKIRNVIYRYDNLQY